MSPEADGSVSKVEVMSPDRVSERALAELLAELLADRRFWGELAEAESAVTPSSLLAERAVDLYLSTGRFLDDDPYLDPGAQAVRAVSVLREIGDVAALASYGQAKLAEAGASLPSRAFFEWMIRIDDINDWAAELGCRLMIAEGSELPNEVWPQVESADAQLCIEDFVQAWTNLSDMYGRTLAQFEESERFREGWASAVADGSLSVQKFRKGAATSLWVARGMLRGARRNLPAAAELIALAAVFISQSVFVLGWHLPEEGTLVPSPAYLSELVRDGGLDWLSEQGGEPPAWVV